MTTPRPVTSDDGDEFPRAAVESSIPQRFQATATRHASRIAVRGRRDTLRYDQLNAFANRVARAVRDRAGDPVGAVAVLLAPDVSLVAALLGVLKAGGFYVVLDPAQPTARHATVLHDCGARVLVTDREHAVAAVALADAGGVHVLAVDDTAREAETDLDLPILPSDRCCLVYTAGSTGAPKGVEHRHRTVVHGAWAYRQLAALRCDDRLSLLHAMSTMAGATTLYGALLSGATILPFDARHGGVDRLANWLAAERVTCLHAVPTLFRRLVQCLPDGPSLEDVRLVRLGGEAVTRTEWSLWRRHFPRSSRLQVGLAATEVGLIRLGGVGRDDEPCDAVLPVGEAVPDKTVLLLDAAGAPVATGGVGEIAVKTTYQFAGYWGRPAETELVRGVDPTDGVPVYRTGDLGRFDADGRLFHVGRADAQAKVDGHRVEVAEVEDELRRLGGVRDAAVVPRRRGSHGARLVAFVVPDPVVPDGADLRARLRDVLPAHLVPSAVTFVGELPSLPDGKADRRDLAARAAALETPRVEPRNPVEETLREIWQRALAVDGLGVRDDFFLDLGGDSLAAVQVLASVAEVFGRELPLSVFFDASTVADMAAGLLDAGWTPPSDGRLVLHPTGSRRPVFAVCGAFGHALRLMLVGQALGDDQPFYGLQPPGMDWVAAGCASVEAMAGHYVGEIRRIQANGPYRVLGTSFGGVLAFEIALQLQRAGADVELLAMVDTKPPDCVTPAGVDRFERRDWRQGDTGDRLVAMGVRVAVEHGAALARYRLDDTKRFAGTIVYFRCLEPETAPESDRRRLWSHFASGGAQVLSVPGMHGNFHREPQFSVLVQHLRGYLAMLG